MSQLQGLPVISSNMNLSDPNGASYVSYWPGHVVAECLTEESEEKSSRKSSDSGLKKLTKKLSRTESTGSHHSNEINNNSYHVIRTDNQDSDMIKVAKLLTKLKPGSSFSAIISSMVPFEILTKILKSENARLRGMLVL